jgi:uncharacterized protein (TIGR02145 family)
MKKNFNLQKYTVVISLALMSAISNARGEYKNPSGNTVTDIDGNIYQTISIGTQIWMAENLKTTKFSDGTRVDNTTDNTAWNNLWTPSYCWYNNDVSYKNTYGALYNWYAVNTGKLCPAGWHIPSDAEWTTLTNYLGSDSVAGGKLKEAGNAHWISSNIGATNESGFTALPGGNRIFNGTFEFEGVRGSWWTASGYDSRTAWQRVMYCIYGDVSRSNYFKRFGFSVRCVKD